MQKFGEYLLLGLVELGRLLNSPPTLTIFTSSVYATPPFLVAVIFLALFIR
jgi:hypothetical protein